MAIGVDGWRARGSNGDEPWLVWANGARVFARGPHLEVRIEEAMSIPDCLTDSEKLVLVVRHNGGDAVGREENIHEVSPYGAGVSSVVFIDHVRLLAYSVKIKQNIYGRALVIKRATTTPCLHSTHFIDT